jgi:hypothetical protein
VAIIVLILAAVVVVASPEISDGLQSWVGVGGGSTKKVAIIYIYAGVTDNNPGAILNQVKNLNEVEATKTLHVQTNQFYSVKSFYAKYGVVFSFNYYSFKTGIPFGYARAASCDDKAMAIITSWAKTSKLQLHL